jgi:small multidrug resistance pump
MFDPASLNRWLLLGTAIVAEVIGTSFMKSSEGFTRLGPSLVVVLGYGLAFYLLSLTLQRMPVGVAYAVWSGTGIALITLIAWLLHASASTPQPARPGPDHRGRGGAEPVLGLSPAAPGRPAQAGTGRSAGAPRARPWGLRCLFQRTGTRGATAHISS